MFSKSINSIMSPNPHPSEQKINLKTVLRIESTDFSCYNLDTLFLFIPQNKSELLNYQKFIFIINQIASHKPRTLHIAIKGEFKLDSEQLSHVEQILAKYKISLMQYKWSKLFSDKETPKIDIIFYTLIKNERITELNDFPLISKKYIRSISFKTRSIKDAFHTLRTTLQTDTRDLNGKLIWAISHLDEIRNGAHQSNQSLPDNLSSSNSGIENLEAILLKKMKRIEVVISGITGSGKTSLVHQFSFQYVDRYIACYWFDASSRQSLLKSYSIFQSLFSKTLADLIPDIYSPLEFVKTVLAKIPGWLLIFDNCQDYRMITSNIPSGLHHIIFTSRNQLFWPISFNKMILQTLRVNRADIKLISAQLKKRLPVNIYEENLPQWEYQLILVALQLWINNKSSGVTRESLIKWFRKMQASKPDQLTGLFFQQLQRESLIYEANNQNAIFLLPEAVQLLKGYQWIELIDSIPPLETIPAADPPLNLEKIQLRREIADAKSKTSDMQWRAKFSIKNETDLENFKKFFSNINKLKFALLISVGQEYYEGEQFEAGINGLVDFLNNRLGSDHWQCDIIVADTLQYHNNLIINAENSNLSDSEKFYKEEAEKKGSQWIAENKLIYSANSCFRTRRWSEFLQNPKYITLRSRVTKIYETNHNFKDHVNKKASDFILRHLKSRIKSLLAELQLHSKQILIESVKTLDELFQKINSPSFAEILRTFNPETKDQSGNLLQRWLQQQFSSQKLPFHSIEYVLEEITVIMFLWPQTEQYHFIGYAQPAIEEVFDHVYQLNVQADSKLAPFSAWFPFAVESVTHKDNIQQAEATITDAQIYRVSTPYYHPSTELSADEKKTQINVTKDQSIEAIDAKENLKINVKQDQSSTVLLSPNTSNQFKMIQKMLDRSIKRDLFWKLPPSNQKSFIGREKELQVLKEYFNLDKFDKAKSRLTSTVVCAGTGGVGKTQLALYYAYSSESRYRLRCWFPANQLIEAFQAIGLMQGCINKDATSANIIKNVKQWFEQQTGWLIVFDDVWDEKTILPFIPKCGGHVLITSRYQKWSSTLSKQLIINPMNPENALTLLQSILGQAPIIVPDSKEIKKPTKIIHGALEADKDPMLALINMLGYLPLAIAQAGAYMRQTNCNPAEYINLCKKYLGDNLHDTTIKINSNKIFPLIWQVTMTELRTRFSNRIEIIEFILLILAFTQPQNIPTFMLRSMKTIEIDQIYQALEILECYSMLNFSREDSMVSIHLIVQNVLQKNLIPMRKNHISQTISMVLNHITQFNINLESNVFYSHLLLPHFRTVLKYGEEICDRAIKSIEFVAGIGMQSPENTERKKQILYGLKNKRNINLFFKPITKRSISSHSKQITNFFPIVFKFIRSWKNEKCDRLDLDRLPFFAALHQQLQNTYYETHSLEQLQTKIAKYITNNLQTYLTITNTSYTQFFDSLYLTKQTTDKIMFNAIAHSLHIILVVLDYELSPTILINQVDNPIAMVSLTRHSSSPYYQKLPFDDCVKKDLVRSAHEEASTFDSNKSETTFK